MFAPEPLFITIVTGLFGDPFWMEVKMVSLALILFAEYLRLLLLTWAGVFSRYESIACSMRLKWFALMILELQQLNEVLCQQKNSRDISVEYSD